MRDKHAKKLQFDSYKRLLSEFKRDKSFSHRILCNDVQNLSTQMLSTMEWLISFEKNEGLKEQISSHNNCLNKSVNTTGART
jgi:hypothetical protein